MTPEQEARFFAQFHKLFETHKKSNDEVLRRAVSDIKAEFVAAFPEGDMKGHCDYHNEVMEQVKARKEFWQKMRYEIYRWGFLGFLLWVLSQIAHAVGVDFWKLIEKFGGLLK